MAAMAACPRCQDDPHRTCGRGRVFRESLEPKGIGQGSSLLEEVGILKELTCIEVLEFLFWQEQAL